MSTIDLNTPPPNHVYSVSVEREETISERRVRLFKEITLFLMAIAFFVTAAGISFWELLSPSASAEEKKWAMSVVSAAAGGILGYLIKK